MDIAGQIKQANIYQDGKIIRSIFDTAGVPAVIRTIVELAASSNSDDVWEGLGFANDAALYGRLPESLVSAVREELPHAGLFSVLANNLSAPNYAIRRHSIYALGKLGFGQNAAFLDAAFPRYAERDPLLLDSLLFELFWLSDSAYRCRWTYVRMLVQSPSYLTRWAALEILARHEQDSRGRFLVSAERAYDRLCDDQHPEVRADAEHCLRSYANRRATQQASRKRRVADEEQFLREQFTGDGQRDVYISSFFGLRISFDNYRSYETLHDYDVNLLDAWMRYRAEHAWGALGSPPDQAAMHAYFHDFTTWRTAPAESNQAAQSDSLRSGPKS